MKERQNRQNVLQAAQGWFDGEALNLFGSSLVINGNKSDFFHARIEGANGADHYPGVYSLISMNSISDDYCGYLNYEIFTYGDVGEYIIGTMTGTVSMGEDDFEIVNGHFKVIRLSNSFTLAENVN